MVTAVKTLNAAREKYLTLAGVKPRPLILYPVDIPTELCQIRRKIFCLQDTLRIRNLFSCPQIVSALHCHVLVNVSCPQIVSALHCHVLVNVSCPQTVTALNCHVLVNVSCPQTVSA
jgi:hypothetical protein